MSSSTSSHRSVGPASLYANRHPLLFLALAPAMVCALIILIPASIAGLFLIIPGISGCAGLIGLTMAWLGLALPGWAARRHGTIVLLLASSLPAICLGLSMLLLDKTDSSGSHWIDPMSVVGPASAVFAILAVFFVVGAIAWESASPKAVTTYVRRWKITGIVVVLITLPLPLGYALAVAGYGKYIRQEQGAQAEALSRRAMAAVDVYRSMHAGAFPIDNASAGLPLPKEIHDTYIASVTVASHQVTLDYKDDAVARRFGAGAADVRLIFQPDDVADGTYSRSEPTHWTCVGLGFRLEGDMPLLLNGRCRNS